MTMFLVRATHPAGFRSWEWAVVEAVVWRANRPCYRVRFIDRAFDHWPVYDPSDPYEFRPLVPDIAPDADWDPRKSSL